MSNNNCTFVGWYQQSANANYFILKGVESILKASFGGTRDNEPRLGIIGDAGTLKVSHSNCEAPIVLGRSYL